MDVKIRYSDDKKSLIGEVKSKEADLMALCLGIMFGKDEQIVEVFGEAPPRVIVEDDLDEKGQKNVKDFEELLDKFYEHYYNKDKKSKLF